MLVHILYVLRSEESIANYYGSEDGFRYLESKCSEENSDIVKIEFFTAKERLNFVQYIKKQNNTSEYLLVAKDEYFIPEGSPFVAIKQVKDFATEWSDSYYEDYDKYIDQLVSYIGGSPSKEDKIIVESIYGDDQYRILNAIISLESKRLSSAIENFYKSIYLK